MNEIEPIIEGTTETPTEIQAIAKEDICKITSGQVWTKRFQVLRIYFDPFLSHILGDFQFSYCRKRAGGKLIGCSSHTD